jgi:hypothetical protein
VADQAQPEFSRRALAVFLPILGTRLGFAGATARNSFDFHNGFWINLHQRLHQAAGAEAPVAVPVKSEAERTKWQSSVGYYREQMVHRNLLFDDGMIAVKNALEDGEQSSSLSSGEGLPAAVIDALESAAPAYRANLWNRDRRFNREWIGHTQPLI